MSQSKLFDYNSSFAVTRTNPKLSGNFKITVDSNNGVWFNSVDANPTLSDNRFKKFNITGENSFSVDLFNFFDQGQISKDLVFQVANFTNGASQSAEKFSDQYDFFYGSGASVLVDKNYKESFKYFAPLWVKNELPDFFVVFKLPNPVDYPYSTNVTTINSGKQYKIIQDYTSTEPFVISYGKSPSGNDIYYGNGEVFSGLNNYSSYTIISGTGKVAIFNELAYLPDVLDVEQTFKEKILNNCTAIKTFDLRENTKIGKYIRSIFNNPLFSKSPLDVSWGSNSYTYFKGVSYAEGVFTKKGELLSSFLSSADSDPMIDFEDYVTSGFSRNGIICPNLLNLEFIFDDDESNLYTINRYIGFYVSRNDIASVKMNGSFFYDYKNLEGNNNLPKPSKDNIGYYYNNYSTIMGSTSGIRLFYEGGSGFLPGSDDVNLYNHNKLFYITDKANNFYSLKRSEDYLTPGGNSPAYAYGPFDYTTDTFSATGSTGATAGSVVIGNTITDLLNFTGSDNKVATIPGINAKEAGRAYAEVEFLKQYDLNKPLTFKIYWPNGSQAEGSRKYDVVRSGDFSAIFPWAEGAYYFTGDSYYFNASAGTTDQIASAFSGVVRQIDPITWDSGYDSASSVIRLKNPGSYGNTQYSISVFDDYTSFLSVYKGNWSNSQSYSIGDVVLYDDSYYSSNLAIPSSGGSNLSPGGTAWSPYKTFNESGYVKINGIDASAINYNTNFVGGTRTKNNRIIFDKKYSNLVQPGYFMNTTTGRSEIISVTKYVDSPKKDTDTESVIGFNNFNYLLVANLADENAIVALGSDNSFNTYSSAVSKIGVFTFFDTKEFDFDFWSSNYGYTPIGETFKYFQLQEGVTGSIDPNIPYLVKSGQILYNGNLYDQGAMFYGVTGYTSFTNANPSIAKDVVVFPAQYSNVSYNPSTTNYQSIGYYKDLDAFIGFLGIQDLNPSELKSGATKEEVFIHGKLNTEYEYLRENYTPRRANISRIVPYINKWGYYSGFDARGNDYRLNSSPAFSPLNFSPTLDRVASDPQYMSQEWLLLERPPRKFPKFLMNDQNSYLAGKIDLDKAKSSDPDDYLYLPSYFTVEPEDYDSEFRDTAFYTKELFTPLEYNPASGYYETLFRGAKIVIKKRSSLTNSQADALDRYVTNFRGYQDYKFSAILRAIPEDSDTIQPPVTYEVIENTQQKFILFVCNVVIKDHRVFPPGYTGGTGGDPVLDYTSLYSIASKNKLNYPLVSGSSFTSIDDIKLSVALDLSLASGSYANTTVTGVVNSIKSKDYEVDLRQEIHTFFVEIASGATSGVSSTGAGSFTVPSISCSYPWPIGVGPSYIEFGKVATASNYTFTIPFSPSSPVTIPVGPSSIYKDKPVFQLAGGDRYYESLLTRCTAAYISKKTNSSSPYIKYKTYYWNESTSTTEVKENDFEIYMEKPTKVVKVKGSLTVKTKNGPQELRGSSSVTGYDIIKGDPKLSSIMLRYSGGYEPLFRKVIHFDKDKTDTISGSGGTIDLSFRNCNFAPNKLYFGISRNLSYTKVSLGSPILSLSNTFPEGPRYPYIGQTPIAKKDFNIFSSSWDPGYYEKYSTATTFTEVAGTRSMKEFNTFFGSKMMQTPDPVSIPNYINLEISRSSGDSSVSNINSQIESYIKSIQSINSSNSGTGIGNVGPYLSGVDYDKLDLSIFPNAEIVWQYFSETRKISGTIRLDRMLRRYLLNSGIKQVFIDNTISDFGVGDPNSINDDVNEYIELNVAPIYEGGEFDLYVMKTGEQEFQTKETLRGDIFPADRYKMGYYINQNYKLTKVNNLVYNFEFPFEKDFDYSLLFNFSITKI